MNGSYGTSGAGAIPQEQYNTKACGVGGAYSPIEESPRTVRDLQRRRQQLEVQRQLIQHRLEIVDQLLDVFKDSL